MKVQNMTEKQINKVLKRNNITAELRHTGSFISLHNCKRLASAYRIVYFNPQWNLQDWSENEKGKPEVEFYHNQCGSLSKPLTNSKTLGHNDWFNLVSDLLDEADRVDLLGEKFNDFDEYEEWCCEKGYLDYIDLEKAIRKHYGQK